MLQVMIYAGSVATTLDKWCETDARRVWLRTTLKRIYRGQVLGRNQQILAFGYGDKLLEFTEHDTPEQRSIVATLLIKISTGETGKYIESVTNE